MHQITEDDFCGKNNYAWFMLFLIFLFKNHFFQELFSYCWDNFDYAGFIVYLSCSYCWEKFDYLGSILFLSCFEYDFISKDVCFPFNQKAVTANWQLPFSAVKLPLPTGNCHSVPWKPYFWVIFDVFLSISLHPVIKLFWNFIYIISSTLSNI